MRLDSEQCRAAGAGGVQRHDVHRLDALHRQRDGNLKTLADLRGKTVVCTAGTNTLARVNGLNQKQNLGMRELRGREPNEHSIAGARITRQAIE